MSDLIFRRYVKKEYMTGIVQFALGSDEFFGRLRADFEKSMREGQYYVPKDSELYELLMQEVVSAVYRITKAYCGCGILHYEDLDEVRGFLIEMGFMKVIPSLVRKDEKEELTPAGRNSYFYRALQNIAIKYIERINRGKGIRITKKKDKQSRQTDGAEELRRTADDKRAVTVTVSIDELSEKGDGAEGKIIRILGSEDPVMNGLIEAPNQRAKDMGASCEVIRALKDLLEIPNAGADKLLNCSYVIMLRIYKEAAASGMNLEYETLAERINETDRKKKLQVIEEILRYIGVYEDILKSLRERIEKLGDTVQPFMTEERLKTQIFDIRKKLKSASRNDEEE